MRSTGAPKAQPPMRPCLARRTSVKVGLGLGGVLLARAACDQTLKRSDLACAGVVPDAEQWVQELAWSIGPENVYAIGSVEFDPCCQETPRHKEEDLGKWVFETLFLARRRAPQEHRLRGEDDGVVGGGGRGMTLPSSS